MPYWKKTETRTDRNGVVIKVGDVLKSTIDPTFIYYLAEDQGDSIEVRDFNGHNVCMCELSELINLGPWQNNLEIMEE